MDEKEFDKYFDNRYMDQIRWYDSKSKRNKDWYNLTEIIVIVSASLTPIFIALDFYFDFCTILKFVPIAFSVLVAILSTIQNAFSYKENWLNYRTTCESLKKEQYYYSGNLGDYCNVEDKETLFIERVESLISRENTMWVMTESSEKCRKIQK